MWCHIKSIRYGRSEEFIMGNTKVGLIPAGGKAKRISPLPCSKEIYPVGMQAFQNAQGPRPKVAAHYLLEKMVQANVQRVFTIIRKGKWDIPAYFGDGKMVGVPIAYLIMDLPYGVPYTLDQAYPYAKDSVVFFGFPDIVFSPDDAFIILYKKLKERKADVVVGLFEADKPHKMDMVNLNSAGDIKDIEIKPSTTTLTYTWIIAVWSPNFTQFMHDYVEEDSRKKAVVVEGDSPTIQSELYLGHVIRAAIHQDLKVSAVIFEHAEYIDIGTPNDILKLATKAYNLAGEYYDNS